VGALEAIGEAQSGKAGPSYAQALREIRAGRKSSHWIWYVWPTLRALRPTTSRPAYLLPDLDAVRAWMCHTKLQPRLLTITEAAIGHLEAGKQPRVLFGSATDADKFHEAMTLYAAVAAAALRALATLVGATSGDAPRRGEGEDARAAYTSTLQLCDRALEAIAGGKLHDRTMAAVADEGLAVGSPYTAAELQLIARAEPTAGRWEEWELEPEPGSDPEPARPRPGLGEPKGAYLPWA
jgi:uncharacterized protein (DUF1810 family)